MSLNVNKYFRTTPRRNSYQLARTGRNTIFHKSFSLVERTPNAPKLLRSAGGFIKRPGVDGKGSTEAVQYSGTSIRASDLLNAFSPVAPREIYWADLVNWMRKA